MIDITYDLYNKIADLYYEELTDQEIMARTNATYKEIAYVKHIEELIV